VVIVRGGITADFTIISSKTSGEVEKVEKDIGDRVEEGDLILKLDPADSEAELSRVRERLDGLVKDEKKAKEEYEKALAQYNYLAGRYQRFKRLYKAGAVARMEVVRTKDEYEFARLQKEKAEAKLDRISGEIDEAKSDLEVIEGESESIFIVSPRDGFITRCLAWEGGYLFRGEEAAEIAADGDIYFTGKISPDSLPSLGDDAKVVPVRLKVGYIPGYVSEIVVDESGNNKTAVIKLRLRPKRDKNFDLLSIDNTKKAIALIYTEN
jgi:multidrug resistance efflux pump